jgi:hypothetical protein
MDGAYPYVHSLLFRCKRCKEPLSISVMSAEGNLENIDGNCFDLRCECGWLKSLLGVEAIRHWVVPWEVQRSVNEIVEFHQTEKPRVVPHIHVK